MTTRRTVLKASLLTMAGATAMTSFAPSSLSAKAPQIKKQAPGFYRLMLGDIEITALSDGTNKYQPSVLYNNAEASHVEKLLSEAFISAPMDMSVNAFLVNDGEKLVLIDTGTGAKSPTIGLVTANLVAAGYRPEDVDDVILTHAHGDHLGGLLADGKIVFPNATVHIAKDESDYWLSPKKRAAVPEKARGGFDKAAATLKPYQDAGKLKTFVSNAEPVPGFRTKPYPGHTPGHTAVLIESKGEKLLLWADITHGDVVQFKEPAITVGFDTDNALAAKSREAAMAEAAKERCLVAGAHLRFPGIGHVAKDGEGYRWFPVNYSVML